MDGVPLKFDIPINNIITNAHGASSVTIQTMGHGKASFTVVLGCTASGKRIPLMVIFKQKTAITVKFQPGIIVHQDEKGWMDNGVMDLWLSGYFINLSAVEEPPCP